MTRRHCVLVGSTLDSVVRFRSATRLHRGSSFAVITISHSKPLAPELRRIQLAAGWRDYRIAGTNMPTMDECRRKAEECLRWADEAANDRQRETLLEIARLWTQMELSSAGTKWCGQGCSGLQVFRATKVVAQAPRSEGRPLGGAFVPLRVFQRRVGPLGDPRFPSASQRALAS